MNYYNEFDRGAAALLAGWPTSQACQAPNMGKNRGDGAQRERQTAQTVEAIMAGWATATVQDAENNAGPSQWLRNSLPLNCEAHAAGMNPAGSMNSSSAGTTKCGAYRLNPLFSLWLMGFRARAWACCGERAMQLCRKSRRSS